MNTINRGIQPVVAAIGISEWGHPLDHTTPQGKDTSTPVSIVAMGVQQVVPVILIPLVPSTIDEHNAIRIGEEERQAREGLQHYNTLNMSK